MDYNNDSLLDIFLFETDQLIEQLEDSMLTSEKENSYSAEFVDEVFRIMHTIKGSAAMMMYESISLLAHSMEDLFYYVRGNSNCSINHSKLTDLILEGIDFIKSETDKIKQGVSANGNSTVLISSIQSYLLGLKEKDSKQVAATATDQKAIPNSINTQIYENTYTYRISLNFDEGCEMENIRAYGVVHHLKPLVSELYYYPEEIIEDDATVMEIRDNGFHMCVRTTMEPGEIAAYIDSVSFKKSSEILVLDTSDLSACWSEFLHDIRAVELGTEVHFNTDISSEEAGESGKITKNTEKEDIFQIKEERNNTVDITVVDEKDTINNTDKINNIEEKNYAAAKKIKDNIPEIITAKEAINGAVRGTTKEPVRENGNGNTQSLISVNVGKLDKLMDLVGEMVIAEAMVIENSDLKGLELNSFYKAARQLSKITDEIQDMVMSIRMVPLAATFHKMQRIVRDMCKKLDKKVNLIVSGEETEVDKSIIEHISDPLMHLVRNALDHGIEMPEDRIVSGKNPTGTISLEAKNAGSDVLVIIKDDGKGLSRENILRKAREKNLLTKAGEEYSDKEVFGLITLPGFSTKDEISEFSGRGVGMDVVTKNIEMVGGSITIESIAGNGTTITLKIPLTLAIIDGMNIKVKNSYYTLPTIGIREFFRPDVKDIIMDPDGNDMIMLRGNCYPIVKLYEYFKVSEGYRSYDEGIMIMIEHDDKVIGIFADELLGQQQVVVKAMPEYIRRLKRIKGLAGCTLLGDGNISLILDVSWLIHI
ncbi:chemotaxis protein CheA [Anaerocolumna sp. AGMB13020]|uniref:chemotaxis protein CheA n=1 Tax=Anaerocolumna sp. AGMB13020 TaxID=3081750 RepID=UPI0029552E2C|nr:chemotaxis protein CheA [Anaerocolumna sp. AGMB13020]WOO38139.1 chemotaxis protein CheA [Anaerocolumna sp. AGMB13020]